MRLIFNIILWILFIIISVYILPPKFYNLLIYSIFILWALYQLILNFLFFLKFKKGDFSDGKWISYKKKDETEILDINYIVDIEFTYNENKYIISSFQKTKPISNTMFKVLINKKRPNRSVVVTELNLGRIFLFIILIVIFTILSIREVILNHLL